MKETIGNLKEQQPNFELKNIFSNEDVERQCLDILYGKGASEVILGKEKSLTLKKDLAKESK